MAKAIGNVVQKHTVLARCGKSCHSQWLNHLSPNLKNGAFTLEEEWLIIELHVKMGNKWARITAHFRKVKEAIDELSRAIAFKTDLHFWATFHKRIGDVMGRCATVELLSSLTPIIMRCLNFIFVSTPRKLELKNARFVGLKMDDQL